MSIILVNPPSLYHMPKFRAEGKLAYFELSRRQLGQNGFWSLPGEHLGLGSIVAACAQQDIPVQVVNGQVLFHRTVDETWQEILNTATRHGDPEIVGFTGPAQVFTENLYLANLVKRRWPECVTVLGHDFATLNYQRILAEHPEFDVIVLAEAEESFPQLSRAVLDGHWPTPIAGTLHHGGHVKPAPALDIDSLPWPARIDLPNVIDAGLSPAIFTSRGCPYRCTYCTTGATSALLSGVQRHRTKSLDNVLAEIQDLVGRHKIQHLTITDDLFVTKSPESLDRAAEFARRLIATGIDITFMIDCRVDSIDRDVFRLLYAAGLRRVFIGVETSSPHQLEIYNKRYTRADARRDYIRSQLAIPRELGIDVIPGIITYHAESTVSELIDALDLIDSCDIDSSFFFLNRLIAYPGTPLYHRYQQRGLLTVDWPMPRWEFADPDIAMIERTMLAAEAEGRPFAELREMFATMIGAHAVAPLAS